MNVKIQLEIKQIENITKITNNSEFKVFLSHIPKKPKVKYIDFHFISPGTFLIFNEILDLTKISFRFEG